MARKNKGAKEQTFNVTAPAAMSVLLAGDFTHGQQRPMPMQKNPVKHGE